MKKKLDWHKLGSLKFWLGIFLIGNINTWFFFLLFNAQMTELIATTFLASLTANFVAYVIANVQSKKHRPKEESK